MYAKVFSQMYDGSLCTQGPWQALVTFQQMLVLADQDGVVDMTAEAIARRTTIPLEIIVQGIEELLKPDAKSRTPTEEGRRIIHLSPGRDWGWQVVNYKHYRQLKREEDRREYHRDYWKKRKSQQSQQSQQSQPSQPIAEAEAEAEAEALKSNTLVVTGEKLPVSDRVPYMEIVKIYHETLPQLPQVMMLTAKRKGQIAARWKSGVLPDLDTWRDYFTMVSHSPFLMGLVAPTDGRKRFVADLEWLTNETNFTKVWEGKYNGA